jgi:mannitol operon repressor
LHYFLRVRLVHMSAVPISKKRTPQPTNLDVKELNAFLSLMKEESDRGAVLTSVALLDDLLERSIRSLVLEHARVDQLFDSGPLGSLSSRALIAFVLGILSEEEYEVCDRVRKIRNEFAHRVVCTFETPKVKDICANLIFVLKPELPRSVGAKQQYIDSVIGLLVSLSARPGIVAKRRLKYVKP